MYNLSNYTEESNTVNVVHMKTHKNNRSKNDQIFLNKQLYIGK